MRARKPPVGHDGINPVPLVEDVHTKEQIRTYLECLADGVSPDEAARRIGSTGTRMNRFRNRSRDFDHACGRAQDESDNLHPERVKQRMRALAFQDENLSVAVRAAEVEAATWVPAYAHLRRDRMKVEQRIEHALVITDEQLERLTDEQLLTLRGIIAAGGGAEVVDAEFRELPSGELVDHGGGLVDHAAA